MARRHVCDVPGCGRDRARWQRICERCFGALPGDIRSGLIAAHQANRRADWRRQCKRAGEYMNFDAHGQAHPAPAHPYRNAVSPERAAELQRRLLGET